MLPQRSRFALLLAAMVCMAGCSGIPLSTMWHFRNFGPEDLLHTDPSAIRAAVQLKDGIHIKAGAAKLEIGMKFEGESPQTYHLPLKVLREGPSVGAGVGEAEPGKHWYLFALSPQGGRSFRVMQQELGLHVDASGRLKKHGEVNITVHMGQFDFGDVAMKHVKEAGKIFVQIRLELSPRDGYYTLYEGEVPYTFSKSAEGGAAASD
ncbi:MAG: hypothetical protein L0I62_05910 [Gammaproteobacteria bacterium]|nr:hypothetical protein [Gammaproteobacteria bacterium]